MSTSRIHDEIRKFLRSSEPEVLCIRGSWGTGKTYNWTQILKDEAAKNKVGLKRYAYVSLFGFNSLQDIKQEVFHRSVDTKRIGEDFDSADVKRNYELVSETLKVGGKFIDKLTGSIGAGQSIVSLMVRDQIICIDDLERKGEKLQSGEVLGYISQLRHERGCKIVLLLNDFKLGDKPEFDSYLEKVVDVSLRFAPSAKECADIALSGDDRVSKLVRGYTEALNIDNIRVIRKVHRLVAMISVYLKDYEPEVLKSVAKSIVLFGWGHYQPGTAPSIEYLRESRNPWADIIPRSEELKEKSDPKVEAWKQTLRYYGHTHSDEFDLVLIQGVVDGYFDQAQIDLHANLLHERTRFEAANTRMRQAFEAYDYSFIKSQDEAFGIIIECFQQDIKYLGLEWLQHIVQPLRKLGLVKETQEQIDFYFENRLNEIGAFDYTQLRQRGDELDKDIFERCNAEIEGHQPNFDTDEILLRLGSNSYDNDLVDKLTEVPVSEYVRIFKAYEGEQLSIRLRGINYPLGISNPTSAEVIMLDRGKHPA